MTLPLGGGRLSDRAVKAWVAKRRAGEAVPKKLSDGGSLFLMLTPAGSAAWRLKYRITVAEGVVKERLYAIGIYPEISLSAAREERDRVRALLREGRDPVKARRVSRVAAGRSDAITLRTACEAWLEKRRPDWSEIHATKAAQAFERDLFPLLGDLPIAEITAHMIATALEKVAARGAHETASRILQHLTAVYRLALSRGLVQTNAAEPVREELRRKRSYTPRPAILTFEGLGDVLRRAEAAHLSPSVRRAHRLVAFTAARIGNVIDAKWSEFQLDDETPSWVIPRSRLKVKDRAFDLRILLGKTIAAELREWARTKQSEYLFPSPTGRAFITRESLEKIIRDTLGLAGVHSIHGYRASFATLARDAGFAKELVDIALDHLHDTAVSRSYDRGERLAERARLMEWWGEQLDAAQRGSNP